jgi:hypothetical protein
MAILSGMLGKITSNESKFDRVERKSSNFHT